MKRRLRKTLISTAALALILGLLLPVSGCNDYKKIKQKAEVLQALLTQIRTLKDDILRKINTLAALESQDPVPEGAVQALKVEIASEQAALNNFRDKWDEGLAEAIKELKELDEDDLDDVFDYINDNFPDLSDILTGWLKGQLGVSASNLESARDTVSSKLDTFESIMVQQQVATETWGNDPVPAGSVEMGLVADLIVQGYQLNFHEEMEALEQVEQMFAAQGPVPVRAGSTIDRYAFSITNGMPEAFASLNDGPLGPGSHILLQLPRGWTLTAPAAISSETLELDVCGNDVGSNTVRIAVLADATPTDPNDAIDIATNGIRVRSHPGVVEGAYTVMPGRSTRTSFLILPTADCTSMPLPSGDIDGDGIVDFGDFAIMAQHWLATVF